MKDENAVEANPAENSKVRSHRLFLDDFEYSAFTRRLEWSPDGSIMLSPAACYYDLK